MQSINRKLFFDSYREGFGPLSTTQVQSIESLLGYLENDSKVTDLRHAAYMLATAKHETANTYRPIKEYGEGRGYKYGKPDPVTGQRYFGRGVIQLTWKANYEAMGQVFKVDLVNNPDLALNPEIAYKIMSYGMRTGAFTGVGLSKYINETKCDYVNARRIINGTDKAELIAGYAVKLEKALRAGAEVA